MEKVPGPGFCSHSQVTMATLFETGANCLQRVNGSNTQPSGTVLCPDLEGFLLGKRLRQGCCHLQTLAGKQSGSPTFKKLRRVKKETIREILALYVLPSPCLESHILK